MPLTVPCPEWCNARSLNFYPRPEGGGRGWPRKLLEGVCQSNSGTFTLYHAILIAREFSCTVFPFAVKFLQWHMAWQLVGLASNQKACVVGTSLFFSMREEISRTG